MLSAATEYPEWGSILPNTQVCLDHQFYCQFQSESMGNSRECFASSLVSSAFRYANIVRARGPSDTQLGDGPPHEHPSGNCILKFKA